MAPGGLGWPSGATSGPPTLPFTPVFEDAAAGHQIVITGARHWFHKVIAVSCNCLHGKPIRTWGTGQPGEAVAAWRAWHEERGVTVE